MFILYFATKIKHTFQFQWKKRLAKMKAKKMFKSVICLASISTKFKNSGTEDEELEEIEDN